VNQVVDLTTGSLTGDPARSGDLPPLRVLIGLEGLALGGCPINALQLGRTLRSRGHEVSVFAIDEDVKVSLLPFAESCGFSPVILPTTAGIVARARQIRALAARAEADVVHVFGPWLGPAASIAAASRRHQGAVVTNWTMENVFYTPRHTPMIVGTNDLATELRARHPGPVWLMEPPVDLEADAPDHARGRVFRGELGLDDDHVVAVLVSRVDSHMKTESMRYAIEACARIRDPLFRFVIVGDGDAFAEMNALADAVNQRLGWQAVLLPGARHDPRPAYDAADIALGMGGSALRALAHSKPLVVLGENGFARTFSADTRDYFYEAGFFGDSPEPDPVAHLTGEIQALLKLRDRGSLGRYGLNEVRERFGLEIMSQHLEAIYRQTLTSLPGAARRLGAAGNVTARTVVHELRRALPSHA